MHQFSTDHQLKLQMSTAALKEVHSVLEIIRKGTENQIAHIKGSFPTPTLDLKQ